MPPAPNAEIDADYVFVDEEKAGLTTNIDEGQPLRENAETTASLTTLTLITDYLKLMLNNCLEALKIFGPSALLIGSLFSLFSGACGYLGADILNLAGMQINPSHIACSSAMGAVPALISLFAIAKIFENTAECHICSSRFFSHAPNLLNKPYSIFILAASIEALTAALGQALFDDTSLEHMATAAFSAGLGGTLLSVSIVAPLAMS